MSNLNTQGFLYSMAEMFDHCGELKTLKIGNFNTESVSAATYISKIFDSTGKIEKLICTTDAVPQMGANADWLAALITANSGVVIYVPDNHLNDYQSAWGSRFAEPDKKIKGVSELSNN